MNPIVFKSITWPFIWLYRSWTLSIGKWLTWAISSIATLYIFGVIGLALPVAAAMSAFALIAFLLFLFGVPFSLSYEKFLINASEYEKQYDEPEPHYFLLPIMSSVIISVILIGLFLLIL